jgi:hypothetical protein
VNAIRLFGWILFAVTFPLLTLLSIPIYSCFHDSYTTSFIYKLLHTISYEELIAVAFTLSAASGIDAIITGIGLNVDVQNGIKSRSSTILGVITIFITFCTMIIYFCVGDPKKTVYPDNAIFVEQALYILAVALSFSCEYCAMLWT